MELNVGDYCRTSNGNIFKIIGGNVDNYEIDIDYSKLEQIEENWLELYRYNDNSSFFNDKNIIKSSPNIIDLIEVGDYVNGLPVERIEGTLDDKDDIRVWFGVATYGKTALNQINHRYTVKDDFEDDYSLRFRCIKPDDIKSIITREQFEAMQYVVGDTNVKD